MSPVDLHLHTTASDGTLALQDILPMAQARGLTAIAVTDEAERRALLGVITRRLDGALELEDWVQRSPLVRVDFGSSGPTVRARS